MGSRGWNSNKGRKDIRARRGPQKGNNTIAPQHPGRGAWREMENDGVDWQELLVARNNKRGGKICGGM